MKKSSYIFILLLLSANFFGLKPMASWMAGSNGVIGFALVLFWIFIGFFFFRYRAAYNLCNRRNNTVTMWLFVGIFLSMIPAYLFFGQSIGTSLITYRVQYYWITIPLILYVCPSERDIIKSLNLFAILFFFTSVFRTWVFPEIFYMDDNQFVDASMVNVDREEIIYGLGLPLLLIPLYYYCGRLRENVSFTTFLPVLLYVLVFYVVQNRSTLFIVLLVVAYSTFTNKSEKRIPLIFFTIIIAAFFVWQTQETWLGLFDETVSQLDNENYNRVLALDYFLNRANTTFFTTIFGNGFLSARATKHMFEFMEMGIFNSDVGFIGYWNQFGLIPIVVFISCIVKAIFCKSCPFYVKAIGFHILACALTISYFGGLANILWFTFFYYLFVYHTQKVKISKQ